MERERLRAQAAAESVARWHAHFDRYSGASGRPSARPGMLVVIGMALAARDPAWAATWLACMEEAFGQTFGDKEFADWGRATIAVLPVTRDQDCE